MHEDVKNGSDLKTAIHKVMRQIDLRTCLKVIRFSFKSMYLGLRGEDPHLIETRTNVFAKKFL